MVATLAEALQSLPKPQRSSLSNSPTEPSTTTSPKTPCYRPGHKRSLHKVEPNCLAKIRECYRGESRWPLYLWSEKPGTGKSSASMAVLDRVNEKRGFTVNPGELSPELVDLWCGFVDFHTLPKLMKESTTGCYWWREAGTGGTIKEQAIRNRLEHAGLIVLDDVLRPGRVEQRFGEDHCGILKWILDVRINRPLIITSNIEPWKELAATFDARIFDRIASGTVVHMPGDSRRWE